MADKWVKGPDGSIGTVPEEKYQRALDAGWTNATQEEAAAAQDFAVGEAGEAGAVEQGLLTAPAGYSVPMAAAEKAMSAFSFGTSGRDPKSVAEAQRFTAEHPGLSMAAEAVGQLPAAVVTGGIGEAAVAGARGAQLGARAAARGLDWGVNAAVGGVQTEAEEARLSGEDFSWTDAAVAGLAGEAIGRGAVSAGGAVYRGGKSLVTRAAKETVARDVDQSLTKGGLLNDYRVAHHADEYQAQLADLAAKDLDALETSFAEVSRQDRKRARVSKVIAGDETAQAGLRAEAQEGLSTLYDALSTELGQGAPGPAGKLLKQLDDRMDALADAPTGKRLWRLLDENRQALQEYMKDLSTAYENNPGSAWLSREGLQALESAEAATRQALLREDAWGREAAQAQAAYNVPFYEKYFPTEKTIRGQLMFSPATDAKGFPVFRGDPAKVRRFFSRAPGDVDSSRLAEQFTDYLDGVEAIARAGAGDAPAAARETLERVRRLRKASANAQYIQAATERTARRGRAVEVGAEVAGGVAGAAAGGLPGAALGFAALRGARAGDFILRAARKLGWAAGDVADMAKLLDQDALPAAVGRDQPVGDDLVDDLVDAGPSGPSTPPPSGAPPAPGGPVVPGRPPGGGLTASEASGAWQPSVVAGADDGADGASFVDELAPEPEAGGLDSLRPGREARAATPTAPAPRAKADPDGPEPGLGRAEALELEGLRETTAARRRDEARLQALTEGEFKDLVRQVRGSGSERAQELADRLTANLDALKTAGLVVAGAGGAAALAADDQPEGAAGAAVLGIGLLSKRMFPKAVKLAAESLKAGNPASVVEKDLFNSIRAEALGTVEGARAEAKAVLAAAQDAVDGPAGGLSAADQARERLAAQLGIDPWVLGTTGPKGFGEKLSGALGSNDGGWYRLPDGGSKAYVKFYDNPEQAVSEYAANQVYGARAVPETRLFVDADGRLAHVSYDVNPKSYYDAADAAPQWVPKTVGEVTPAEAKAFVKDFWRDVLLANWDVVGLTGDNLLFRSADHVDGVAVKRIDNGSALKYRAQGAEKPPAALAKLTEVEGFFNRQLNPNYAELLRKADVLTPYDLVADLHRLIAENADGRLTRGLPPDAKALVEARFALLQEYAAKLEPARLRELRENIGASRRLGAGFKGDADEAYELVEAHKPANPDQGREAGANALPAPPPATPAAETSQELYDHPGLRQLVEVSKRKLEDLTDTQRRALGYWVDSSRAIRAATAGGLDPLAERVSKYGGGPDPAKSVAQAKAFNDAMDQLTVVNPTKHGPLFRFIDLPDKAIAELLQKDDFIVTAPTSTGYIPDPNFGSTEFRFRKVDSAGALIGRNPTESEMILLADARFRKVGQYYDDAKGGFVFEFEEVPETTKSPAWGDLGHLSLGPLALAAGAAADPEGAVEDGVAGDLAAAPTGAAAAFGATAALFKQGRAKLVKNVAKRLFSGAAEPALRTVARLAYSRGQLVQRQEEFQAWQADPQALVERVAEGLRDAPPEAFGAASAGVFAAASFLREKLPQSSKPNPVAVRGMPVSAEAASKYARYEQAALRPGEALEEASQSGYISPELLETLQELYPDLLAEVRVEAYQAVRSGGPALSIQAKTQYARLFDGDGAMADPAFSTQATQMVQMAYEESAATPANPKAGAGPRPGVSQVAVAVASPRPWAPAT